MHVVITGASSGIGEALARAFAAQDGARLTLVARRRAELERLARELGGPVHVVAHDLADPERATAWLPAAEGAHGPVDVLVNNAGVMLIGTPETIDVAAGERSIALNLSTPLRLIHAVLPSMLARGEGHIVNIASMAALAPTPSMTYYNASKAGLAGASEALRGELGPRGVGVVTVYPGLIAETELARAALATYATNRMLRVQPNGTSAELARRVAVAVRRGRARVIYPRLNALARWFPGTTRFLVDRYTPALRAEPTP